MSPDPRFIWSYLLAASIFVTWHASTHSAALGFRVAFLITFLFRYVRLYVSIWSYWTFKPRRLSTKPRYSPSDISCIVSTKWSNGPEHIDCLRNILRCGPGLMIVVTATERFTDVQNDLASAGLLQHLTLLQVPKLNKRLQMQAALDHLKSLDKTSRHDILCFGDDDVVFSGLNFLPAMLACFEDPMVGAAGPKQRVTYLRDGYLGMASICHILGIGYLERRNFNTGAAQNMDGSLSTLSGRTSFFRASILQDEDFQAFFMNALNKDDDKNLTRWVFSNGHKIQLQFHEDALIHTSLETDYSRFRDQCLRWARGHWRGNFRVMATTSYWYKDHTWSFYGIYLGQFQTPAILMDSLLTYLLAQSTAEWRTPENGLYFWSIWAFYICCTKLVKMVPHFCRHPRDMLSIPVLLAFSYIHGFINVYALFTMHESSWGITGGSHAK